MKNKSFDVSLVAFLGFFILSAGLFTVFSTGNVKSVYKDITAVLPSGGSQLAAVNVGQSVNVTGWSWSSNIGWISFSGANAGAGGGSYQVKVDKVSNTLATFDGYAWSSNIGWISFRASDVSGCPVAPCGAQIDLTDGAVKGWARVLSMQAENGGGWLELSGTNHTSPGATPNDGVTYKKSNGAITGKAWESSAIGWTNFTAWAPGLTDPGAGAVKGSCSSSPSGPVAAGTSVTFSASASGGTPAYDYKWGSAGYGPGDTSPAQIYNVSGSGPSLKIRDSLGATYDATCPYITVNSGAGASGLFIGSNLATTKTSHTVRQGTNFVVRWDNTLPSSLNSCSIAILPNDGNNWQTPIDAGLGASITSGNVTGLTTTNVPRGTYSFSFSCSNSDESQTSDPSVATLRVISASVEEF